MKIVIETPEHFDTKQMSAKFIRALYGESMEEFVARLAREAQEQQREAVSD